MPDYTGKRVFIKLTTDEFVGRVIRRLVEDEDGLDPEVGPMWEIAIHVYEDEVKRVVHDLRPLADDKEAS